MTTPKISVVLPIFNGADFLSESINSILNQTFRNFELLLIDDGSTDASLNIISGFNDSRITVIRNKKNEGLINTLNKGIELSKGEYIARMDADDISFVDRFEKQLHFLEGNPAVGVCGTLMHMIHNNKIYTHRYHTSEYIKAALVFNNPIVHPSVMMRKQLFIDAGSKYDINFLHGEDYALWISLLPKTEFAILGTPLISYRAHGEQVSRKFNETQRSSVKKSQEMIFNYLNLNASDEEKQLHTSLFLEAYEKTEKYISEVETWLLKLLNANETVDFFEKNAFKNIIGEWWYRVNQELVASGLGSYSRFKKSHLAENYQPSASSVAKLRLKSILRTEKKN